MTSVARSFFRTILVAAGLALVWLCWHLIETPVDTAPIRPPQLQSSADQTVTPPLDRTRVGALPETVARPLFSPTRRPPAKVVETAQAAPPAHEPDVQLVGVLKASSWRALLRIDQNSKWLGVGDDVGRWRIVDIGSDHVVLETKGQKKSLALPGAVPR